jgi:hypothetical protein
MCSLGGCQESRLREAKAAGVAASGERLRERGCTSSTTHEGNQGIKGERAVGRREREGDREGRGGGAAACLTRLITP